MGAMELIATEDEARAEAMAAALFAEFMRPPASITVSQWADRHRLLSGKASSEPGPWRTDRTPYLRQIMDDLSARSTVQEVVVMFAAQLGKSESGMNWLGYIIDNEPGPVMVVQPTTDMAKRFSRQRIAPMLEETPALRRKVRENRSRDDANTTLLKDFAGGVLVVSGANSAASLRSMPVRYLFLDEIDAYPLDVDGEGDPVALAEKRTSTFARRKVLKVSTPTTKNFSRIEAAYLATNASRYFVPCPHCGEYQVLEWGANTPHGLRWDKLADGTPDLSTVRYVCAHCGSVIEEHHKPAMLAAGEWRASKVAARPGRMTGYHLNALYAPLGWISWADLVAQWHDATLAAKQGDVSKLKTFTNTVLAETWEEVFEKADEHALMRRAEPYRRFTVPRGGLVLVAGIDVQDDRFEIVTWAIGRGEEMWCVDYSVLHANPADEREWEAKLDPYLDLVFQHECGTVLKIEAAAIDTGGHFTHQAYNYCRMRERRRVFAVKGEDRPGRPVKGKATVQDVNWRGKVLKRGVRLWYVGTDTAKDLIYGRLRVTQPGPGYVHFSRDLPPEFYNQLTAESRVPVRTARGLQYRWVNPRRARNEALDCTVYALFCTHMLNLHVRTDAQWKRIAEAVQPANGDLSAVVEETQAATSATSPEPVRLTASKTAAAGWHNYNERRAQRGRRRS